MESVYHPGESAHVFLQSEIMYFIEEYTQVLFDLLFCPFDTSEGLFALMCLALIFFQSVKNGAPDTWGQEWWYRRHLSYRTLTAPTW